MKKTLLIQTAPMTRRAPHRSLSRVWIPTGNPRQPLTALWLQGDNSATLSAEASDRPCRLCA